MTDTAAPLSDKIGSSAWDKRLQRRYAAERRFRFYGALAIATAIGVLAL